MPQRLMITRTDTQQAGRGPKMTQDDPCRPDSGLIQHRPSVDDRLAAPARVTAAAAAESRAKPGALASATARPTGTSKGQEPAASTAQVGPRTMTARRNLTPIKRIERYVSALFKLGRINDMAKDSRKRINRDELRLDRVEGELDHLERDIREIGYRVSEIQQTLEGRGGTGSKLLDDITLLQQQINQHQVLTDNLVQEFHSEQAHLHSSLRSETSLLVRVFTDLSRRVDLIGQRSSGTTEDLATPGAPIDIPASEGFEAFKDSFYHRLENRYRGSVEEIADRLRIYLPDVEAAVMRSGGKPVMDMGCGRGEWLGLLKRAGIDGFGVDTNAVQIEAAREQGLDVRLGDALRALTEMDDNSLAMISAHHLVEHLPFDAVAWIAREALRVLAPGGILLFETPNTRNVLVGATTFHTDPTHLKPMPEQVLTVLYDTAGFDPVEVRALNPHARFKEFLDTPDFNDELAFLLFGPQDLAVLGTKPAPKNEE